MFAVILIPTLLLFIAKPVACRHLQFQLSGFECFFEEIEEKTECSLEYAPITGADPRIDVYIEDPHGTIIYKEERKDYDLHKFTATISGTYRMCFSNVFDFSIEDNLVYFDFVRGKEGLMDFGGDSGNSKALTRLETSVLTINENLNLIERYQNYHRLREANGRLAADALGQKVLWWSVGQSVIVMSVGVAIMSLTVLAYTALVVLPVLASGRHLMFLLNGVQCVYENVDIHTKCFLDVALMSDSESNRLSHLSIIGPEGREIRSYRDIQYEHFEFIANETGVYQVCVANIHAWGGSEEKVYLDWVLGEREYNDWFVVNNHGKALTLLEAKTTSIHENLRIAEGLQLRDRLVFARGMLQAMTLNSRVMWWSAGQAFFVIFAGALQVYLLRRFFTVTKEEI